ncbi:MAG TPA: hypothetical protein VMW17_11380 [Candidatus Binatia bacterium]|nr:hypothetical protein [Candidatus Binatia bacterium]
MSLLHHMLSAGFALLLDPLAGLPPLLGLTVISTVSGLLILLAFRCTSNPAAVRRARQRAQAHLLAVRLYRDDLVVVARSQWSLVGALAAYVGLMLIPFAALLVPFALLFAHIDARYGSCALRPGERALVKAFTPTGATSGWQLEAPDGLTIESPPVRIPSRGETVWRIRADKPGCHRVALVAGPQRVEKLACVANGAIGASSQRAAAGVAALFSAPTEPLIETAAKVDRIEITYPTCPVVFYGWHLNWLVVCLIVSAAVAWFLRKPFGVEF